jgi:hypothetical protein
MRGKTMDFKKNPPENFMDIHRMTQNEARREVDALREAIDYHDYLYYVKNSPEACCRMLSGMGFKGCGTICPNAELSIQV